jgi:heptosyltransferase-2
LLSEPKNILVIQTAFIGDAILASSVLESLHHRYPSAQISILLRKGNELLYQSHPFLYKIFIWNKKEGKYKSLLQLLNTIRKEKFDIVINLQRFASSGFLTAFSRAKFTVGFKKNPLSQLFNKRIEHSLHEGLHEIERNHRLVLSFTNTALKKPKLYPNTLHFTNVTKILNEHNCTSNSYYCFAPSSVWFTKQLPVEKWITLAKSLAEDAPVFILGADGDSPLANQIIYNVTPLPVINLCGKINFLESAALMQMAKMNFVNDSAPLHIASSVNAPVTAFFCSTVPDFGFGPLSDTSQIIQTNDKLQCRPCGLHGYKVCPKQHFICGHSIPIEKITPHNIIH